MAMWTELSTQLRTAKPAQRMSDEDYHELTEDQLIERIEEMLRSSYAMRDRTLARALLANTPVVDAGVPLLEPNDPGYEAQEAIRATAVIEPAPTCPYCKRLLADCDTLRETKPDIWGVICSTHPDIQKAKDERLEDERDGQQFLETGYASARMRAKDEARKPQPTEEEKRQAEKRRELGWHEGVWNETSGYRRRE